jgi:hypothetical protein
LAPDTSASDNLTALSQYAGSAPGRLDVVATVSVRGEVSGGAASYAKTEAHRLSLPVALDRVVSLCIGDSDQIRNGIVGLGPGICNATAVSNLMSRFRVSYTAAAIGLGLGFNLFYSLSGPPGCGIDFSVSVSQQNVDGPLGQFGWTAEQAETFSL